MIIISESDFLVPVKFLNINTLDIINVNYQRDDKDDDELKEILFRDIRYFFFKITELTEYMSFNDKIKIYEKIYLIILERHLNSIKCINGVSVSDELLKNIKYQHLTNFKEVYIKQLESFKCSKKDKSNKHDVVELKNIDARIYEISEELNDFFNKMASFLNYKSAEFKKEVHSDIYQYIVSLIIKNIECFEVVNSNMDGNISLQEMLNMYFERFKEVYDNHVNYIKCKN